MINIRRMWQPLTATPFLATAAHHEIPPCESLQRWIRCFWGGIIGAGASPTRIIPDVCADLIYHIDETAGRIIQASFCGVSDVCGTAHLPLIPGHTVSTFAIRFHAFGAYAFADDALRGTLNGFESPEVRFGRLDRALRARLLELDGLPSRAAYAQSVLLAFQRRENPLVETAADVLLCHRGTATISEWAHELFISSRQLERLLGEYWGMTPKKGSALVRYQALYQEICRGTLNNVQDAVARYGFADQAHLCREFRRYHGEMCRISSRQRAKTGVQWRKTAFIRRRRHRHERKHQRLRNGLRRVFILWGTVPGLQRMSGACVPCAGGLRVPDLRLCAGEKGLAELRAVPRPAMQPLAKYPRPVVHGRAV